MVFGGFTGFLFQLGFHARRRIRRTHAEEGLQEPFAASHRRRALRIGGDGQQRTLAQQALAHVLIGPQFDPTELRAVDAGDAVVPGEPLVDEGVIRRQQILHAAVFLDDAGEEQFDFAPERLAQRAVEIGEQVHHRLAGGDAADIQPLAGEVPHQRLRTRIGDHAIDLLLQYLAASCSLLAAASLISSMSGMLLHRKNDRRDASSRSLIR